MNANDRLHPLPHGTSVRIAGVSNSPEGIITGVYVALRQYEVKFGPGEFYEYPFSKVVPVDRSLLKRSSPVKRGRALKRRYGRAVPARLSAGARMAVAEAASSGSVRAGHIYTLGTLKTLASYGLLRQRGEFNTFDITAEGRAYIAQRK